MPQAGPGCKKSKVDACREITATYDNKKIGFQYTQYNKLKCNHDKGR